MACMDGFCITMTSPTDTHIAWQRTTVASPRLVLYDTHMADSLLAVIPLRYCPRSEDQGLNRNCISPGRAPVYGASRLRGLGRYNTRRVKRIRCKRLKCTALLGPLVTSLPSPATGWLIAGSILTAIRLGRKQAEDERALKIQASKSMRRCRAVCSIPYQSWLGLRIFQMILSTDPG